jgi:hypothetical protein
VRGPGLAQAVLWLTTVITGIPPWFIYVLVVRPDIMTALGLREYAWGWALPASQIVGVLAAVCVLSLARGPRVLRLVVAAWNMSSIPTLAWVIRFA